MELTVLEPPDEPAEADGFAVAAFVPVAKGPRPSPGEATEVLHPTTAATSTAQAPTAAKDRGHLLHEAIGTLLAREMRGCVFWRLVRMIVASGHVHY
jgi:hypothetical protein